MMDRVTGHRLTRAHLVVACLVLVTVIASSVAIWLVRRNDGGGRASLDVELPPPPSGMVVGLERLGSGNTAAVAGSAVPLVVSVAGQAPLAAIELWAGDQLAERRDVEAGTSATR